MVSFAQINRKISQYNGTKAPAIYLVTRSLITVGEPRIGRKPVYEDVETQIEGQIDPYTKREWAFVTAQGVEAEFYLATPTDIEDIEINYIKHNGIRYSIIEKLSPKMMIYNDAFVYLLKREKGQDD